MKGEMTECEIREEQSLLIRQSLRHPLEIRPRTRALDGRVQGAGDQGIRRTFYEHADMAKNQERSSVEESDNDLFLLVGLFFFFYRKEGERNRNGNEWQRGHTFIVSIWYEGYRRGW